LDESDNTSTLAFSAAPPPITVGSLEIQPENEGELATYKFSLIPSVNIEAGSTVDL